MSPILEQICANTYTDADMHRRLGLMQSALEDVLFHTHDTTSTTTARVVTYAKQNGTPEDAQALQQWGEVVFRDITADNLVDQMQALRTQVEHLSVLTVYVPVPMDSAGTQILGVWCREHMGAHVLLELLVDPNVVGGCAFVANDTYHDRSLRYAMHQHTGVVTNLLNGYV